MNTQLVWTALLVGMSSSVSAQDGPEIAAPAEVATWDIGRCVFTGQRQANRLVHAQGRCGEVVVFASSVSAEPARAEGVVVKAGTAVVSGPNATWNQDTLTLRGARLQTDTWAMSGSQAEISLDTAHVTMKSPGWGEKG
ncbi:MAG: hypothetical protein R3E66_24325 [bacterium]